MMDDELLIRFCKDTCSKEEEDVVLSWIKASNDNKTYYIKMKNLYVSQSMPCSKASQAEYLNFLGKIERNYRDAKKMKIGRFFISAVAASIIVLLALNLHFNWLDRTIKEPIVRIASLPTEKVNTLYVPKGVKGEVLLPDGTKVWLNSDSKITYPARFIGASREVEFSGEGYFDVAKDSLCPMIVRCNKGFRVEVYGTKFNIKSYDNDKVAQATLYSGSIKLVESILGREVVTEMKPNESFVISEDIKPRAVNIEKPKILSEWKDGNLVFDSTPLSDAAKILERWHGVKVILKNDKIASMPITARFKTESIFQIMDLLNFSMDISYEIKDNIVIIQ